MRVLSKFERREMLRGGATCLLWRLRKNDSLTFSTSPTEFNSARPIMSRYNIIALSLLLSILAGCHKQDRNIAQVSLHEAHCHVVALESYCEENGGGRRFEIADIPEEFRDRFITACSGNLHCDVVLSVPRLEARDRKLCKIVDISWSDARGGSPYEHIYGKWLAAIHVPQWGGTNKKV